jgi:16S rRNA (cytosine967-C5)-methyltransferase
MNARAIAATALNEVFVDRHTLSTVLSTTLDSVKANQDKGLIQELCYGVMRWYPRLEWYANQLLDTPLKARDRDVLNLLLVGIYQLLFLQVPRHAAVNETVAATKELGKPWARHMINAVLRSLLRDHEDLLNELEHNEEALNAHPIWLLELFKKSWPGDWQQIIEVNNQRPPMCLRVNRQKMERAVYLRVLAENGFEAQATPYATEGIELGKPVDVSRLPGFAAGQVSVQDAAAQLTAHVLDVLPGHYILDACAAPGGKTAHILELQHDLRELVAVDIDESRIQRTADNLQRLGLQARLICADAAATQTWWNGEMFDRILVDAPCSASGIIRRHPDIKYMRRQQDINALVKLQGQILNALWPLLKRGGMLLYVTCSVIPAENDEQITSFLACQEDAVDNRITAPWGRALRVGRQILPGEHNMDGFYFASLSKR